ncbi:hypothetical protein Tco_0765474 [Tanacetum coccineum]
MHRPRPQPETKAQQKKQIRRNGYTVERRASPNSGERMEQELAETEVRPKGLSKHQAEKEPHTNALEE